MDRARVPSFPAWPEATGLELSTDGPDAVAARPELLGHGQGLEFLGIGNQALPFPPETERIMIPNLTVTFFEI